MPAAAGTEIDPERMERAKAAVTRGPRARWWRRRGARGRFWYLTADGARITDSEALERIKRLAVPPAWQEVRVNPRAGGRIQAMGIDSIGRLQYRYHPDWAARRQRSKFSRLVRFGENLPRLRERASEDIGLPGLPQERVLAAMIRLINHCYFRPGSEKSARRYRTFGITTFCNRHLAIEPGGRLVFSFVGKRHVRHRRLLADEELAGILRELKRVGGSRLFHYLDEEGRWRSVTPSDVNRYIKEAMGAEFSAKDFRTWHGTLLAASELAALGPADSETAARRRIVQAVRRVAEQLGNTPSVCRSAYIHPAVLESYQRGVTLEAFRRTRRAPIRAREPACDPREEALLALLRTAES